MITGRDFIVFSDDWGRHPFSCQHLMQQFLPCNRALWVQTIGMRRPRLTLYDLKRSFQKLKSFAVPADPVKLPENLVALNPVMLPFGNALVRWFNRESVIRSVRRAMAHHRFRDPIVLTTLPNAADYLGAFGEECAVYYCVDDFTRWPGANKSLVVKMEERLLRSADLLVCSSSELASLKSRKGLATGILPHGVDFDHFSRAVGKSRATVPGFNQLKKPAIGYFGLLGEWVDLALLEEIVRVHPDWTLVLMGNVVVDIARLAAYPNVVLTGPVPYDRLPDHVGYLDVLLLPYHTTGRGHSITPLKLREYIATGIPVVSTAIPECRLYDSVISVVSSPDFPAAVEDAMAEGRGRSLERQNAVRSDGWDSRAEMLSQMIMSLLSRTPLERGTCVNTI